MLCEILFENNHRALKIVSIYIIGFITILWKSLLSSFGTASYIA